MKKTVLALWVCALCITFFACKDKEQPSAIVPLVQAVKVTKTNINWDIEYPAQVAASLDVEVRAQVSGILKQKFFKEGDYIEQNQQLFLIDPDQYEIALSKAKGSLAQADSDMKKTKRDYDRMQKLYKENAVSRKDYDDSLSAYEKAKANFQVAQSGVDEAKVNLTYTKVLAPASGVTRNDAYSEGSLISVSGQSALLLNVLQIDPLDIKFSIPSQQWYALRTTYMSGKMMLPKDMEAPNTVDVQIIASDGTVYPKLGKMKFIDSAEDADTGTIKTKATVDNPDKSRLLMPGQFVKVILKGMIYKDAVVLPQGAVLDTAKGKMVYVVGADGKANLKPVTVTPYKDYVVAEGLEEGETVITSGIIKVKAGAPVQAEIKTIDLSALQTDIPAQAAALPSVSSSGQGVVVPPAEAASAQQAAQAAN